MKKQPSYSLQDIAKDIRSYTQTHSLEFMLLADRRYTVYNCRNDFHQVELQGIRNGFYLATNKFHF